MIRRLSFAGLPTRSIMKWRAILSLALLLPLLSVAASQPLAGMAQAGIQPALLSMAASQPDSILSVIVQKYTSDRGPEHAVLDLGGKLTRDLHIINAFAAEVPARAVSQLSHIAGVRWVSLNAPVERTGSKDSGGGLFESDPTQFTTWASDLVATSTSSISSGFVSNTIHAGSTIWFNSVLKVTGLGSGPTTVTFDNANIQVNIGGHLYNATVPEAAITFSPAFTTATTTYDTVNGRWVTNLPMGLANSNVFLTGSSIPVPVDIPGVATTVTFSGRFTTDTPGVNVNSWQWAASAYSSFSLDNNAIGVKPCDDGNASQWRNSDKTGTPENFKPYLVAGARGNGGNNYTGDYSPAAQIAPAQLFKSADLIVDGGHGPNATYGWGGNATQVFGGFMAETVPDQRISHVEVALQAYVPTRLASTDDPRVSVTVGGQQISNVTLQNTLFDPYIGQSNAGPIYVDVTGGRNWTWGDFDNGLQVKIDQPGFSSSRPIFYDAVGLRVTTASGTDTSGGLPPTSQTNGMPNVLALRNVYNQAVRATDVWNTRQGQGQTIAVVDSGVTNTDDLKGRVIGAANFNDGEHDSNDSFGHGTFVAGIIAGDGKSSDGAYTGIAPKANILNVRVSGDDGSSTEADTVAALQWVLDNKARFNVRVVNLSLNSTVAESYNTSPLSAAAEVLWFNKIVVVVAAGNNGTANLFPPANDPFVITVGAADDHGTASLSDDTLAPFSAWGTSETGAVKPEIVAPGRNIISLLPQNATTSIGEDHSGNRININYFRMSGTSMSTPMVSAAVALLLQDEPLLNPDQVKYRLMATAAKSDKWPGYDAQRAGAGYLDVYAALNGTTSQSANVGLPTTQLLWGGPNPVNWGSVNWSSVNWSSVNWSSVNWSSVNWSSDIWEH